MSADWQPIETAPIDRAVLIFSPTTGQHVAVLTEARNEKRTAVGKRWFTGPDYDDLQVVKDATLWRDCVADPKREALR